MLELITDTGNVVINDIENRYSITKKYDGRDTLHFDIYDSDLIFPKLAVEALIHETTGDQRYVIRGIDATTSEIGVDCELDLDDWRGTVYQDYYNNTSSISTTMDAIVPSGWSMVYSVYSSQRRSVNLDDGGTLLDIALTAQEKYSCAMRFDNAKKTCTVYYPDSYDVSDTVLTESAAIKKRAGYTGKSTNLVTRIYPVGADGLTIESVSDGGVAYVENHNYTDKVISAVWKDERYENAESLMEDAQAMVDTMGVPEESWEIQLVDLYRADPDKWVDHKVDLYQKVKFQYNGRQLTAAVAEMEIHPYHPELNTAYINSVPGSIGSTLQSLAESVNNPNSEYNSRHAAAVAEATKLITGSRGGKVVIVQDADGKPTEICILSDGDSLEEAESLWRFNEAGLGHSSTGYNGEYSLALTKDGHIVADLIDTGTLNADIIQTGKIADATGNNYWDLDTGEMSITGTVTFSSFSSDLQTKINGISDTAESAESTANTAKSTAESAASDASAAKTTAESAASAADSANYQEQLIYKSAKSGTTSMSGTTTWVTTTSNSQGVWTTRRPVYSSSYPVLFVATQRKNVAGTVTCTTPVIDQTTTVIDGGHITTGSIDAGYITTGTMLADRIKLYGDMYVYTAEDSADPGGTIGYGSGSTGSDTTKGIHLIDSTGNNEVIATSAGVRMTSDNGGAYMESQYLGWSLNAGDAILDSRRTNTSWSLLASPYYKVIFPSCIVLQSYAGTSADGWQTLVDTIWDKFYESTSYLMVKGVVNFSSGLALYEMTITNASTKSLTGWGRCFPATIASFYYRSGTWTCNIT